MEINFLKLNIGSNDILLVDFLKATPPEDSIIPDIAKSICKRHRGVGANGLLLILPGKEEKIFLRYFLSNGREIDVFCDPIICCAKYIFDRGLTGKDDFKVETISGKKKVDIIDSKNFRICSGKPFSIPDNTELYEEPESEYSVPIVLNNKNYNVIPLRIHTGGIVLFADRLTREKYKSLKNSLREVPEFKSQPLIVAQVISRESIQQKTENYKDSREIISTASMSTVASVISGFTEREVVVYSDQTELYVQWLQPSNKIYVTTSADYAFSGTYYLE